MCIRDRRTGAAPSAPWEGAPPSQWQATRRSCTGSNPSGVPKYPDHVGHGAMVRVGRDVERLAGGGREARRRAPRAVSAMGDTPSSK
eukprot:5482464-Prymnesium_polylepis.1